MTKPKATSASRRAKSGASKRREPQPETPKDRRLELPQEDGKSRDRLMAQVAVCGLVGSARTLAMYGNGTFGELSLTDCALVLSETAGKMDGNNLSPAITMLSGQAVALDAMFCELARVGHLNLFKSPDFAERCIRLAFKAQAQSRTALEALAAIKNPPVVIARQANINNGGQQQVNNGAQAQGPAPTPAHAEQTQSRPNELLGVTHGERLDLGAQAAAGGANHALEALGKVHGAKEC